MPIFMNTVRQGQPAKPPVEIHAASGAILLLTGGVARITKAGVAVMTLADPSAEADGVTLLITSDTAQAHTVTNTTGFNNGSTSSDVATFAAAIGNNLYLVASGGVWNVISDVGVTLG